MGLRLHIHLGHGVGVNFGRGGARLYASGHRGATVNLGQLGIRGTDGQPGTGLSWSERIRSGRGGRGAPIVGWLIAIVAVVAIVVALGR
jgi:hypothetical protein